MTDEVSKDIGQLLETPNLAEALESDRFKKFLDHVPVAIAVSETNTDERIVYANLAFGELTTLDAAAIDGKTWHELPGVRTDGDEKQTLAAAILEGQDHVGIFAFKASGTPVLVDAWSNLIEDDDGDNVFRLVALIETQESGELRERLSEKDVLLRELQHRVKNNLQMITALIRLEAKTGVGDQSGQGLDRLAGRVEALALLYQSLSDENRDEVIDLGIYLSQIASAVVRAHATEGIHLDLQLDTWPVSINVAMPAGLVVNELLTNALKHAFAGRDGGTITLHSLVEGDGCRVVIADDGIGLQAGATWPRPGKLSALIVQSLRTNAKASVDVVSAPGQGLKATIVFNRADAAAA